jgi:hypothetical protein
VQVEEWPGGQPSARPRMLRVSADALRAVAHGAKAVRLPRLQGAARLGGGALGYARYAASGERRTSDHGWASCVPGWTLGGAGVSRRWSAEAGRGCAKPPGRSVAWAIPSRLMRPPVDGKKCTSSKSQRFP